MDIFKLSKSLDELIFDVMMWVIFYPYTLFRVLVWPRTMIDYVTAELRKDPDTDDLFDRGLSPPLFLFLSIVIAWALSPDIGSLLKLQSKTAMASAINESSITMLTYRLAQFSVFPFAGALIYEWRTPGAISRESFRQPFYQQAYLCGPLAIVLSVASVVVLKFENNTNILAYTALALLVIVAWYLWSQFVFFRRTLESSWSGALFWALLSVGLGALLTTGLTFLIEG